MESQQLEIIKFNKKSRINFIRFYFCKVFRLLTKTAPVKKSNQPCKKYENCVKKNGESHYQEFDYYCV